jgi:hypothetical protein
VTPFTLLLDLESGRLDPHTTRIERRASDLRGAFADSGALEALLLRTEDGQSSAQPMGPGTVAYVPPCWAHRTVNTGRAPLVFLAVYPAQAGHDYGAIERTGFGQRVLSTAAGPALR